MVIKLLSHFVCRSSSMGTLSCETLELDNEMGFPTIKIPKNRSEAHLVHITQNQPWSHQKHDDDIMCHRSRHPVSPDHGTYKFSITITSTPDFDAMLLHCHCYLLLLCVITITAAVVIVITINCCYGLIVHCHWGCQLLLLLLSSLLMTL